MIHLIQMMNGNQGQMWGMGPWWWVIGILVILAVVWLIVHLTKRNRKVEAPGEKSVHKMLKEKLARGEITEEEYESQRQKIKNPTSIGDPTRVRHSLTSKAYPDDMHSDAEKPEKTD